MDGATETAPKGRRRGRGRVEVWRVHLGAHKTATTHMQLALAERRPALRREGVDFLTMRKVRAAGVPKLHRALKAETADRAEKRRRLVALLRPLRKGGTTVAFSEENLLGVSANLLSGQPYPRALGMARLLSTLGAGGAELHLFLAVRSWDTALPSAYAETLRRRAPFDGGFEAIRRAALAEPPRWSDLVRRLRRGAPKATLRIWRYEDYDAHAREAATLFLGVDPGPLDVAPRPSGTATPSAEAVAEAERLPKRLGWKARIQRTREIYTRLPASAGEKFNPFTEAERATLRAAYEEDLARIEAERPGVLVRWD